MIYLDRNRKSLQCVSSTRREEDWVRRSKTAIMLPIWPGGMERTRYNRIWGISYCREVMFEGERFNVSLCNQDGVESP